MLEIVLSRLKAARGHLPTVAEEAGVPYRTIEKIARGQTADPRHSTVQRLHDYFAAREADAA